MISHSAAASAALGIDSLSRCDLRERCLGSCDGLGRLVGQTDSAALGRIGVLAGVANGGLPNVRHRIGDRLIDFGSRPIRRICWQRCIRGRVRLVETCRLDSGRV